MNLEQFAREVDLLSRTEVEKVQLLAFFKFEREGVVDLSLKEIGDIFAQLHLPAPNLSRLAGKLRVSKKFVKGKRRDTVSLHARERAVMKTNFPILTRKSEEVISEDTVIPSALFENTRGFIESLARQINASYEHNIFDGCAVLMRRLLEVLLILSYEHHKIQAAIKNASGDYLMLDRIVADVKNNVTLSLSRNSKSSLDDLRAVGNFAAHKIYYNTRRDDIKKLIVEYRALIEELLYKSGIRK